MSRRALESVDGLPTAPAFVCKHPDVANEGQAKGSHEGRAGRHRSTDPRPLDPPGLGEELRENFRTVVFIFLVVVGLIGWGVSAATDDTGGAERQWLGVASILGGLIVAGSYWLYLDPGHLASDDWLRNRGKRRIGFVLRHAWILALIGPLIIWIVGQLLS